MGVWVDGWMGGLICGSMGWVRSYNFLHKNAIWDRTSPTYTSNAVYMCAGGFKGQKSSNRIQLS